MKRTISNLLKISAILFAVIFISACGERNKLPANYFKVDDAVYELKTAFMFNKGEVEGGFDIDLYLMDNDFQTKGNYLVFNLVSEQAENITSKSYVFNNSNSGLYILKSGVRENLKDGEIVVSRTSEGYIFEIECKDQANNKVKGYFKGKLIVEDENNKVQKLPNYVLPEEVYDQVTEYLPIYFGVNPPNMEGEYVSAPHALIYESYGKKPDSLQFYSDRYMAFRYTNKQMNFFGKQYDSINGKYVEEMQYGVKITGDDNKFTCYYVVDGYVQGYYAQQSFIFSGIKTDEGIKDFHTGVILLENSGNPNMFEKHSFRVLKDYDGLAEVNNWLSGKSGNGVFTQTENESAFDIWMK